MSNRPLDKINIGYNKTNEEYLGYLEEKNRLVKEQQRTREHQEKVKTQEREKGFNVFLSGANEERIHEQRKKELLGNKERSSSNQDPSQKGARRQWKNPSQKDDREGSLNEEGNSSEQKSHVPKYHNPVIFNHYLIIIQFDLNPLPKSGQIRKKWGEGQGFSQAGQPLKAMGKHKHDNEDEDDYSDDGFEENENEYNDYQDQLQNDDAHNENDREHELEQFLQTATKNDIEQLKQSLSNFGDFKNQQQKKKEEVKKDDDDYIEEDFEEDIPEDNDDENSDDERKQLEALRRKQQIELSIQQSQNNVQTSRVVNKQGKIRPISATFNLAQQKIGSQSTRNEDTKGKIFPGQSNSSVQQFSKIQEANSQSKPLNNYSSVSNFGQVPSQVSLGFGIPSQNITDTPKQPNDIMKKPINTNPFKRPFSQAVPKRMESDNISKKQEIIGKAQEAAQSKTCDNAFPSQPKTIEIILKKLEGLDEWQKETLLDVLNQLEQSSLASSYASYNPSSLQLPQDQKKIDLKFLSPNKTIDAKIGAVNVKKTLDRSRNELAIRILNTYGNPHICGLTEVELFDNQCKKIALVPASVMIRNLGSGPKTSTDKLINGIKLTNDERQMWIGYLPSHPKQLEILFYYNKDVSLGGLKIWNYNKNIIDSTKGIKDVQILINDEIQWEGYIQGGKGQTDTEYATHITLKDGIKLPLAIQPKADLIDEAIEEADEEEEGKEQITIAYQSDNYNNKIIPAINEQQQMSEELRKYRSELNVKQKPTSNDSTPLWLQGQSTGANKNLVGSKQNLLPSSQQQQKRQQDTKTSQGTFDLLDKYSNNASSTTAGDNSSLQSQNSRQQSKMQEQKPQSQIKPNAALGSISQQNPIKSKPFEMNQQKQQLQQNQQWTQPFSSSQQKETEQAIKDAVNKVNQVVNVGGVNHTQRQVGSRRLQNKLVEESLDSLDFFKVTNLGRLQAEDTKNKNEKSNEKHKAQRGKWGTKDRGDSPGKNSALQESQMSSSKKNAHVIVKNPFPDQQPKQVQGIKKQVNFQQEGDILDQWMNMNSGLGGSNKVKTQRDSEPSTTSQEYQNPAFNLYPQSAVHAHAKSLSKTREDINKQQVNPTAQQLLEFKQKRQEDSHYRSQPATSLASNEPQSFEQKIKTFSDTFLIPNLPSGQKLEINILSTWGDMNYVGLTGIEIFDIEGNQIKIDSDSGISASPPDVNILPGYGNDPRTIDKLIDGHYFTNDDLHVWLAPFTPGEDHTISIDFGKRYHISMLRFWNYNKSRIHSYRGARLLKCELDGKTIFKGEIQKAPGNLNDPENCCEIILFTDNDNILTRIDTQDWLNDQSIVSDMENTQRIMMQEVSSMLVDDRPMTATKKFSTAEMQELQWQLRQQKPTHLFDDRPTTSAIITGDQFQIEERKDNQNQQQLKKNYQDLSSQVKNLSGNSYKQEVPFIRGKVIEMNILESWGDLFYVGLNGIEVLDERGFPIQIQLSMVDANPRDMNSIPGHGSDHRTLDKLFDKTNNTCDDHHMWLIPFNKGENHTIKIDFGKQLMISGIKFYNYNKSDEDTLRGARQIVISVDHKLVTPKKGVTLRKAPGLTHQLFDMGQVIRLPFRQGWTTEQIVPMQRKFEQIGIFQEYEAINMPMGYLFRFNLYSTHGDFYYIGLNGMELFDQQGSIIKITKIFAQPLGVHTVLGMESDVRTIDKLINGVNQTYDDTNMWLSPYNNTRSYTAATKETKDQNGTNEYRVPNYVYVVFEECQSVSAIRFWNYSKTPSRGVNEIEILVDDKNIYRGFLNQAPEKQEWDKSINKDFSTTVLFTSDNKLVERFKNNVNYDPSKQQSVQLVNEKKIMNKNLIKQRRNDNEEHVFNEMARPQTMVKR